MEESRAMAVIPTPCRVELSDGKCINIQEGELLALSDAGELWLYEGQGGPLLSIWNTSAWSAVHAPRSEVLNS